MCDPFIGAPTIAAITAMSAQAIAATTLALTVISTGVSVAQQQANANAQEKYQKQRFEATKEAAASNAIRQYNSLQMRQQQETAAAAQAIDQSSMRAAQAAGTARVTAGETGTGGASMSALLNEYRRQELGFAETTIRNQTWQNAQIQLNMEGIRANQQAQIASAAPKPVEQPDYIGAALRIGAGALNAYGTYADITYKQTGVYPGSTTAPTYEPGYGMPMWS